MSVQIKGMMMPINCQTCPFVQNEYPIGGEALVYRCRCTFTQVLADNPAFERNKDCPLVEIPPHGDLIDRDELKKIIGKFPLSWEYGNGVSDCWDALIEAPTIIEEEVEE